MHNKVNNTKCNNKKPQENFEVEESNDNIPIRQNKSNIVERKRIINNQIPRRREINIPRRKLRLPREDYSSSNEYVVKRKKPIRNNNPASMDNQLQSCKQSLNSRKSRFEKGSVPQYSELTEI